MPKWFTCLRASAVGWVVLVAAGVWWQCRYDYSQGPRGVVPALLPEMAALEHSSGAPIVIMALHPRCPCSRASVGELDALLERIPRRVDAVLLVCTPEAASDEWREAAQRVAIKVPRARVVLDAGGEMAARLGMMTSGAVVVYDAAGALLFDGGLTPGRGVTGSSVESQQLAEALLQADGGAVPGACVIRAPVFGCGLVRCHDKPLNVASVTPGAD